MDEFSLIQTYLAPLAGAGGFGLLDDAAIYKPRGGFDLVLTKDSFVEGVHFAKGRYGADTAERLLRTNLSDLAAKAARPAGYLLSIAWPNRADIKFFAGFAAGLRDAQQSYDFTLFGGDTVRTDGPMVISATFIGEVPSGQMVTRSAAQIGDDVWVTGTLGAAMLGCHYVTGKAIIPPPTGPALWAFENAYLRPEPRLLFRKALRQYASACADISDGLLSDARHIAKASAVNIMLNFNRIPFAPDAKDWALAQDDPLAALIELLTFGDDYELIFTAPANMSEGLLAAASKTGLRLTKIGHVSESSDAPKVTCQDAQGNVMIFPKTGYTHF